MNSSAGPKITVITISYNSVGTVEKTITSVTGQTYDNVEYIVIDGDSKDGTVDILKRYRDKIDILIIEPDKGIYYAMNKGIDRSTGEWICFMNSNDYFFNDRVIEDVFNTVHDADIIYGYCIDPETDKSVKPLSLDKFWKRIPINHQSAFVKAVYYKERPYEVKYSISSIYDFLYYWYCNGLKFKYIDMPVAVYDMKGLSFYSFAWLWDYVRISMKYSKAKRIRVFFRFVYLVFVRIYINLFMKRPE
jgi:glycosyltransferase involved in cell wall biosynthesis